MKKRIEDATLEDALKRTQNKPLVFGPAIRQGKTWRFLMGFIHDTGSREFNVESRRVSYVFYDSDNAKRHIWAYPDAITGNSGQSVEMSASQVLRLVKFFENPERRKELEDKAEQHEKETN